MIPEISDERIANLLKRISPIYEEEGKFFKIENVDPRRVAFTWRGVLSSVENEIQGITPMKDIETLHTYAYQGFFKPSIAEVLAQIPEEVIKDVVAFKTHMKTGPRYEDSFTADQEYQIGITTLYKRRDKAS